jgi:hypothetical protein
MVIQSLGQGNVQVDPTTGMQFVVEQVVITYSIFDLAGDPNSELALSMYVEVSMMEEEYQKNFENDLKSHYGYSDENWGNFTSEERSFISKKYQLANPSPMDTLSSLVQRLGEYIYGKESGTVEYRTRKIQ